MYGSFFRGDSYICMHTKEKSDGGGEAKRISSLRCDTSFLNEDAEFFAVQASTGTSTSGLARRSQPISITPLSTLLRPTPPSPTPSPENSVPFIFFAASFRLPSLVLPPCGTDHHPLPSATFVIFSPRQTSTEWLLTRLWRWEELHIHPLSGWKGIPQNTLMLRV